MSATKSKFGRSKFGGTSAALMGMSLGGGVIFAAAFAALMLLLQNPAREMLFFAVFFLATLPVFSAATWAFLVDRESLEGAIRNPEHSVENTWYDAAAKDTFHALMIIGGIGCIVFGAASVDAPVSIVLLILLVVMQISFWISYNIRKRRAI